jgi:hypothetical protein
LLVSSYYNTTSSGVADIDDPKEFPVLGHQSGKFGDTQSIDIQQQLFHCIASDDYRRHHDPTQAEKGDFHASRRILDTLCVGIQWNTTQQ